MVVSESFISQDEKFLGYLKGKSAGLTGHIVHIQLQLHGHYLHRLSIYLLVKEENWDGNGHAVFKALAGSVSLKLFIYNHFSYIYAPT